LPRDSKEKHSMGRPGQALSVAVGWGFHISRQSANEGCKHVSPTRRPPSVPRRYPWYSFMLEGWVNPIALVRPEGLRQWKMSMKPSEIEPADFRLASAVLLTCWTRQNTLKCNLHFGSKYSPVEFP
jgi:hypothetical protein